MWKDNWRDRIWENLDRPWELIIVGGGITGAGILREASRVGLKALLVEARDFASGTSSRSSKLVHGGFRYLKNAQIKLTLESVHERQRLLHEGRGLIYPLGFIMPTYKNDPIPAWLLGIGLSIYDLMAFKWGHKYYDPKGIYELCPQLYGSRLQGGFRYIDAQTDDARLVLRLIQEAVRDGGTAINYAQVIDLCMLRNKQVCGIVLKDLAPGAKGRTLEVEAPVVINATGAWADNLRIKVGSKPRLRHLRGSHLIFPEEKLPINRAVSFWHPKDGRPVFAYPWEGVTIVGTTDVDMGPQLQSEPCIGIEEVDYLMEAVSHVFPNLGLTPEDVRTTYSGIRAVLDTGKSDPSKESREFVLWNENGLLTITGGKLTTFRLMALSALRAIRRNLPGKPVFSSKLRVLDVPSQNALEKLDLDASTQLRLLGRYGQEVDDLIRIMGSGENQPIKPTQTLWAELHWAAHAEAVVHLDDILLRRVRLGLLLPQGGLSWMDKIRSITQSELGWDDAHWDREVSNYQELWKRCYSLEGLSY